MNPITTLNVDLGDGVFVTNRPANFTRQMTYNELTDDELTDKELSEVSGGCDYDHQYCNAFIVRSDIDSSS